MQICDSVLRCVEAKQDVDWGFQGTICGEICVFDVEAVRAGMTLFVEQGPVIWPAISSDASQLAQRLDSRGRIAVAIGMMEERCKQNRFVFFCSKITG